MLRIVCQGKEVKSPKPLNQKDYPYFDKGDVIRLRGDDYEVTGITYELETQDVILTVVQVSPARTPKTNPREQGVQESKCNHEKPFPIEVEGLEAFLKQHGHIGVRHILREKRSECDDCPVRHICPDRD